MAIPVLLLIRMEMRKDFLVSNVFFSFSLNRLTISCEHFVGIWTPIVFAGVNHLGRYFLRDDTLHHLIDHLLLLLIVVIRLQLIAQVPVAQEREVLVPQSASVCR